MAGMLELTDWEFNWLACKELMDKVNSMQEQMGSASRDMEILRNQKNARDKKH